MAQSTQSASQDPRREPTDRRKRPTPMISRYTIFGRRRRNRRDSDPQASYYVDWVTGRYLWALVGILLLIYTDTFSTLHIISNGGGESNPLMRWTIQQGPFWFIMLKIGTALFGFVVLAVHRFFRIARSLVIVLVAAYGLLVLYHIYLLFQIHG